jgi:hypothetical protein
MDALVWTPPKLAAHYFINETAIAIAKESKELEKQKLLEAA